MRIHTEATRLGALGALALVFALAGTAVSAEEPKKETDKKDAKPKVAAASKPAAQRPAPAAKADEGLAITNDDLERMFGPPDPATPQEGKSGAAPVGDKEAYDPLKIMSEQDKKAAEKQTKITAAEKAVADAEANVKNLESRLLATKNPYLPRPSLTPEEQKAVEGMDSAQRVDQNQKDIEAAKAQVEKLKAELQAARQAQ